MFKELFENTINEGTNATITVLGKAGIYKTSFLQYDGYDAHMVKELKKYWKKPNDAMRLATGTGDIREITGGEVEYYSDRPRSILKVTKDENKATRNANETHFKYFYDGKNWFWSNEDLESFSEMTKI